MENNDKFATAAVWRLAQPLPKCACAQRGDFLKLLGQLTPNRQGPLAQLVPAGEVVETNGKFSYEGETVAR